MGARSGPRLSAVVAMVLALALAAGCLHPVQKLIDADVCDLARHPIDLQPAQADEAPPEMPHAQANGVEQATYVPELGLAVPPPLTPEKLPTTPGKTPTPRPPVGIDEPELFQPRPILGLPSGLAPAGVTIQPLRVPGGYRITPELLETLRASEAPQSVLKKLAALRDRQFETQESFESELARALTREERERWQKIIVDRAEVSEAQKRDYYRRLFTPLPPLGPDPTPVPGPEGRPLTLADLQRIGMANSPAIKQATANVQAARGAAEQAGLWPNPTLGFEVDTFGTTGGAGYVGGFVEQLIKTAGKLQLARAAATMDLRNAQIARRRAETDLITSIRRGYFQVLVARENIRLSHLLADFADKAYQVQAAKVRQGGFAGGYEPLYMRYLAAQARGALALARNRYVSAWKQLAAAMGVAGMPPTELIGRIDFAMPAYEYGPVADYVLKHHTDVLSAETTFQQARINLQIARVQPVPDVDVRLLVQRDYTGPPFEIAPSLQVGVPIPVWNRNQGAIRQAQGALYQAAEGPHQTRNNLTRILTDAFERYQNSRLQLGLYRDIILPDLVRVYNGIYARFQSEAPAADTPGFYDVIVAQGNLATAIASYITWLDTLWASTVDVTDLLQTNDFFRMGGVPTPTLPVPCLIDLKGMPPLPCDHPCGPLPGQYQQPFDPPWPQALPGKEAPAMPSADDEARRKAPISPAVPDGGSVPATAALSGSSNGWRRSISPSTPTAPGSPPN